MIDEQWARDHIGTMPSVGGCGASYHDERGDVQDCTSVEPCRACLRRRIEQLEAQRGGSDLVELIRRRYPRMLERGNPLYDAVLADAVQRGGAVVVPADDVRSSFFGDVRAEKRWQHTRAQLNDEAITPWTVSEAMNYRGFFMHGWTAHAKEFPPIPADRVLADGMVGVDREEWEVTSKMARTLANWYNGHEINRTIWPPELQRYRTIHSLRSAKGEVEG